MGIFKKRFRLEVTLWGPDYVGTLDEMQDWFNRRQLVSRIGDSVTLPNSLRAARSKPEDADGSTTEMVTVSPGSNIGCVSSVLYGYRVGGFDIAVGVREGRSGTSEERVHRGGSKTDSHPRSHEPTGGIPNRHPEGA